MDIQLFASNAQKAAEAKAKAEAEAKAAQVNTGENTLVSAGGLASNDIDAVYAEMEKLKAELEAEKAKNKATTGAAVKDSPKELSIEEYLEQKVPVMLYKDGEKYKDDVVISLNGERIQIQRGIQVSIKRKFAQILENQYRQQMIASNLQAELSEQYSAESAKRGINN